MILYCNTCKKKVGEINKGGLLKATVVYCNTCNSKMQAKLLKETNYSQNDITNFFNELYKK